MQTRFCYYYNEKAILNKISTNIYLNGKEYSLPDAYLDQIKKYLRTVDISKEQSDEIINQLDIGINIIKERYKFKHYCKRTH